MTRLRAILGKGLEATAAMWPGVRAAFGWVRRLATVMANKKGRGAAAVMEAWSVTSSCTAWASGPTSLAAASPRSRLRDPTSTVKPCATRSFAI